MGHQVSPSDPLFNELFAKAAKHYATYSDSKMVCVLPIDHKYYYFIRMPPDHTIWWLFNKDRAPGVSEIEPVEPCITQQGDSGLLCMQIVPHHVIAPVLAEAELRFNQGMAKSHAFAKARESDEQAIRVCQVYRTVKGRLYGGYIESKPISERIDLLINLFTLIHRTQMGCTLYSTQPLMLEKIVLEEVVLDYTEDLHFFGFKNAAPLEKGQQHAPPQFDVRRLFTQEQWQSLPPHIQTLLSQERIPPLVAAAALLVYKTQGTLMQGEWLALEQNVSQQVEVVRRLEFKRLLNKIQKLSAQEQPHFFHQINAMYLDHLIQTIQDLKDLLSAIDHGSIRQFFTRFGETIIRVVKNQKDVESLTSIFDRSMQSFCRLALIYPVMRERFEQYMKQDLRGSSMQDKISRLIFDLDLTAQKQEHLGGVILQLSKICQHQGDRKEILLLLKQASIENFKLECKKEKKHRFFTDSRFSAILFEAHVYVREVSNSVFVANDPVLLSLSHHIRELEKKLAYPGHDKRCTRLCVQALCELSDLIQSGEHSDHVIEQWVQSYPAVLQGWLRDVKKTVPNARISQP